MSLSVGVGVGTLRDLSTAALASLSEIVRLTDESLDGKRHTTSIAQNPDGSIFFTAVTIDAPCRIRWAYIKQDGDRHELTAYEEESAIREACRVGPWRESYYLDALGETGTLGTDTEKADPEQLDLAEVKA